MIPQTPTVPLKTLKRCTTLCLFNLARKLLLMFCTTCFRDRSFFTGGRAGVLSDRRVPKICDPPLTGVRKCRDSPKTVSEISAAPYFAGRRNKENFTILVMFFHDPPPKTVKKKCDPPPKTVMKKHDPPPKTLAHHPPVKQDRSLTDTNHE